MMMHTKSYSHIPRYSSTSSNMKWETGVRTYEPLDNIAVDDLVTCAILAKEKGLLNEAGW